VAIKIMPEASGLEKKVFGECGVGLVLPDSNSGNQFAEVVGVGPRADKQIRVGTTVVIADFSPRTEPGTIVLVEPEQILAVVNGGSA
jgi:hypothetical protein